MQRGRKGGLCALCGVENDEGLYWEPAPIVLDFGVPTMPPIEPDMTKPVVCDSCHLLQTVVEDYREDPDWAQRIYGAATAANALMRMGWRPTEALLIALAARKQRRQDQQ